MSLRGRQSAARTTAGTDGPLVEFYLLGPVEFDASIALQRRLVYEAGGRTDGRIVVLLCEHPELLTVGRSGSRGDVRLTDQQLRRRRLALRWVGRGGGCVLHGPGQLAVYPIVPLEDRQWSVGQHLTRLQQGMLDALQTLRIATETFPGHYGIWGRSGQLAACGVSVRRWISCHGMFLNVNPPMATYSSIDTTSPQRRPEGARTTMGCLVAEQRRRVTMTKVRSAVVESLAAAFDCPRYHLHTGHPWLAATRSSRESALRLT